MNFLFYKFSKIFTFCIVFIKFALMGQHPSVQIFFELMLRYDISVDQLLFSEKEAEKSTQRRQLDTLLDSMDKKDLTIITATAKGIQEAKGTDD